MLTLHIVNPGSMGVKSCLGQGGLHSLGALADTIGWLDMYIETLLGLFVCFCCFSYY